MPRQIARTPVAAADVGAFEQMLAANWPAMTGLAIRLVGAANAEDVVQEAVAAAWRLRARYDPARGTHRSWLLALVADHARRSWRRSRRLAPRWDLDAPAADPRGPDPDLAVALDRLSRRQRIAIELFYYLGLPVAEVAQVMDCAEGTVKSTLSDARARLGVLLKEGSDE